ncbi:MAG: aconitase/3-isopropylmalate dehydratase large subunit family protein [Streptosporangiales bacterium]|nr:aconitase/3-isopropylmalate dehydratase large subunit family protein [Streptosporangiales bacterium]
MPETLIQKILRARSADGPAASAGVGDIAICAVDLTVLIDLQFRHDRLDDVIAVHDPDTIVIVMDHAVPAPSVNDAEYAKMARAFAAEHRITRFYDVGRHGIVHQVVAERGLARPGTVLACTDSHTCAAGAFAVAARGLGPAEVLQIVCTGQTWHLVPPTIRYELRGSRHEWVNGKDVFLHIAGEYGDATGHAVEFGGPGVASLPMADRRTIATQGAEIAADFTLFPADDVCLDYLAEVAPGDDLAELDADPGASYADVRAVDLSEIGPMVARPDGVIGNAAPAGDLAGTRVDQAFIGSCANGQLTDLETAARILRGKQVAPGTRLIVTPASQQVYLRASRLGYLADLAEAGAVVTNPTCGACFGYHMGVVAAGENCITASTRNFKGRMGSPEASVFMASPATVAASAVRGTITDVREIMEAS